MKRILIILIILNLSYFNVNGQSSVFPLRAGGEYIVDGCYFKDLQNELIPFTGTWIYQEGNKKITLKFERVKIHLNMSIPSYYEDILEAKYKVEINNNIIFDNLNEPFNQDGSRKIFGGVAKGGEFSLTFIDNLKCETWGEAKIWIENGKLHWDMDWSNMEPFIENNCPQAINDSTFYDNMTLPWNMILTKVP